MRLRTNWLQFGRYAAVGMSGYVVSIATFAALVHLVSVGYLVAASGAFACALTNNFLINRYWTFRAGDGHLGFQATRFCVINGAAFGLSLVALHILIDFAHVPSVTAQAIAVLSVGPPNYVAHRMWSFRI
jgi:putative flippase GtrA